MSTQAMTHARRIQKLEAQVAALRDRLDARTTQLLVLLDQIETQKEQLCLAQQTVATARNWCETCNGSGEYFEEYQIGTPGPGGAKPCPDCDGKGYFSGRAG